MYSNYVINRESISLYIYVRIPKPLVLRYLYWESSIGQGQGEVIPQRKDPRVEFRSRPRSLLIEKFCYKLGRIKNTQPPILSKNTVISMRAFLSSFNKIKAQNIIYIKNALYFLRYMLKNVIFTCKYMQRWATFSRHISQVSNFSSFETSIPQGNRE